MHQNQGMNSVLQLVLQVSLLITYWNFQIQVKTVVTLSFMILQAEYRKVVMTLEVQVQVQSHWKSKVRSKAKLVISRSVVHVDVYDLVKKDLLVHI